MRAGRPLHDRVWRATAGAAAAALVVDAVAESPWPPLAALVLSTAGWAGLLFVSAPARTPLARRQYARGALRTAGLVLVTVGVGHHLGAGLAVLAVLGACSPAAVRWMAGVAVGEPDRGTAHHT